MRKPLLDAERYSWLYRETVYQALRDLQLTGEATAEEREMARRFVLDESDGAGSFKWCCAAAGLDAEKVRDEVKARTE